MKIESDSIICDAWIILFWSLLINLPTCIGIAMAFRLPYLGFLLFPIGTFIIIKLINESDKELKKKRQDEEG